MRGRTAAVVVLAGAVVLVAVAAGVFVVISRPGGRQTAARTTVQVSQAHQVAQALSGLATNPAALVATEAMPQVAGQASKRTVGAKVSADEQSWAPHAGGCTMLVRSPRLASHRCPTSRWWCRRPAAGKCWAPSPSRPQPRARRATDENRGRRPLTVVAFMLAVIGTVVFVPAPGSAQAATVNPANWHCGGVLPDRRPTTLDLNPDGTPVRISPDSRGKYVPVIMVHGWASQDAQDGKYLAPARSPISST